ncbi:MAG: CinA family protein [Pseudolabrys sp.]|nr:CinA family protein [Pseudolabrys sp.]
MSVRQLAKEVVASAEALGITIATAESCTAGALAQALSRAPGAGKVLQGGFVTYTKEMKAQVLGVPMALLEEKSAVCREVAVYMARGALQASPATSAISLTGVAGPEPDEDGNPVGLVFCAVSADNGATLAEEFLFSGREHDDIVQRATECALKLLLETIPVHTYKGPAK